MCAYTPPHTSAFCLSSAVPSRVAVCSSVGSVLMQGCRWRWRFDEVAASVLLRPFFSPCDVSAAQGTSPLLQPKSLWNDLGCRMFAFLLCWLWTAAYACVPSILSLFFPPQVTFTDKEARAQKIKTFLICRISHFTPTSSATLWYLHGFPTHIALSHPFHYGHVRDLAHVQHVSYVVPVLFLEGCPWFLGGPT